MKGPPRRRFLKSLGASAALAPLADAVRSAPAGPDVPPRTTPLADGELRFRQIHLDFHTSPLIPDVGADFDADEFVATLQAAHVNSVTVFGRCHHGLCYYPSNVAPVHPHLKFDLLGRMLEALRRADIRAPVYVMVMWDEHIAEHQPGWRVMNEQGASDGGAPLVRAEAPSTATVTVTEQQSRRIVHVLHYAAERRTPDIDIVEDVLPLVDLKLALRAEKRPTQVYLAPQRRALKFDYAEGYTRVVVPRVEGHQMVVFEG